MRGIRTKLIFLHQSDWHGPAAPARSSLASDRHDTLQTAVRRGLRSERPLKHKRSRQRETNAAFGAIPMRGVQRRLARHWFSLLPVGGADGHRAALQSAPCALWPHHNTCQGSSRTAVSCTGGRCAVVLCAAVVDRPALRSAPTRSVRTTGAGRYLGARVTDCLGHEGAACRADSTGASHRQWPWSLLKGWRYVACAFAGACLHVLVCA